jgi:hypothetical protein
VITVGAHNFATLRDFYRALGWPLAEDLDEYAAFALRDAVSALFPCHKLAHDAHAEPAGSERGLVITAGYELRASDKRVILSMSGPNERKFNVECTTDSAHAGKADLPT